MTHTHNTTAHNATDRPMDGTRVLQWDDEGEPALSLEYTDYYVARYLDNSDGQGWAIVAHDDDNDVMDWADNQSEAKRLAIQYNWCEVE